MVHADLSSRQAGGGKIALVFFIVMAMASVVVLQFGFIFFLLATLPTIVVFFTDREPGKPSFKVVGACNFAATLPFLTPMIRMGIHLGHYDVSFILSDMTVWLKIYSAAAAGWCLIFMCRVIANFIVILVYEFSRSSLESVQKKLVEEWGQKLTQKT